MSALNDLTVTGGTLQGVSGGVDQLFVKGTTNLTGVTVNLDKSELLHGDDGTSTNFTGVLNATDSTFNVSGGVIQYNKINLNAGTSITLSGDTGLAAKNFYSNSSSLNVGGESAELNINEGASITLGDTSSIAITRGSSDTAVNKLNLNGGTIIFDASQFVQNFSGDSVKAAVIGGYGNTELNFSAGTVQVNADKYGEIRGGEVNLQGATIENNGNLLIGARASTTGTGSGITNIDGSIINNNGNLYLGEAVNGLTTYTTTTTVNANSGTLNNAADGVTHVTSGSTVHLNGMDFTNEGVLNIHAGGNVVVDEKVNETAGTDGITTLGGTINVGGVLSVNSGSTLTIAENAVLTTNAASNNGTAAWFAVNKGATLNISAKQLLDYVTAGDLVSLDKTDNQIRDLAGAFNWYGTVDFGDQVVLSDFEFVAADAINGGQGGIWIGATDEAALARAENVTINKALGANAERLSVEAGTLNIDIKTKTNTTAVNDADGDLNFEDATVHSAINLNATGTDTLSLGNVYNLDAYTENTGDKGQTIYTPAEGTVSGIDARIEGDGGLNVNAGYWTANNGIVVAKEDGIKVSVEDIDSSKPHAFNIDSSLALQGGLTFDLSSGNASVSVSNSSSTYNSSRPSATLDLTAGVHVSGATSSNKATISASGDDATVFMNSADVNSILDDSSKQAQATALNNIAINLSNGGTLNVDSVSANFDDFGTTADTSGSINFTGKGVLVTNDLTLAGDSESGDDATSLNIGTGEIYTDSLVLTDLRDDVETSYEDGLTKVTLASGTVNVSHSLTTNAADLIVAEGATLTLGAEDLLEGTLVANKLTINGSTFFDHGSWNAAATDFVVAGSLTVGNYDYDAGASLQGDKLTVADDGHFNVLGNGDATFSSIDVSDAGVAAVNVQGNMTINGVSGDMDDDRNAEDHHGVYFGDTTRGADGVFYVDGSTAKLEFGAEASKAFYNAENQDAEHGVQADDKGNINTVYVESYAQNSLTVNDGGTVKLNLGDQTFNKQQIFSLKEQLFTSSSKNTNKLLDGFLDIGDSQLSGINVVNGAIAWSELADITDIVWDTTNTELGSAKVTGVDGSSKIGGSYGSLEVSNQTAQVQIVSNTSLSNAAGNQGNFIGHADGSVAGALVHSGQNLILNGAGKVGAISLQNGTSDDDTLLTLNATASGDAITVNGSITGNTNGNNGIEITGEGTTTVEQNINVGTVMLDGSLTAKGDITSTNVYAHDGGVLTAEKNVTTQNLEAHGASTLAVAGDLTLGSAQNGDTHAVIEDSSRVTVAGDFTAHGGLLRIGSDDISNADYIAAQNTDGTNPYDAYVDDAYETSDGLVHNEASSGYFEVKGETNLNGATIFADPAYGMQSTVVAFNTFDGANINRGQLGTLDGNIVVGKNAAVGLGMSAEELAAVIARYQTNGSLSENNYGSILYVNGQLNVQEGNYIALNGNSSNKTVAQVMADFGTTNQADLSLGANTALIISDDAVQAATRSNDSAHDAAIKFNKTGASIYAETDAAVLLDGTTFSLNELKLFGDADGGVSLTTEDGNGLYIGTVSGLFEAVMEDGDNAGSITLRLTRNGLENTALSYPVRDSIYALLGETVKVPEEPVTPPETETPSEGEGTTGDTNAAGNGTTSGTEGAQTAAADTPVADTPATEAPAPEVGSTIARYSVLEGSFIATALAEQASMKSVEQAARLGAYAGMAQAALGATATTTEAIAGRLGMGAQAGSITFADNGQGAGIWLSPVYKNHSSDGFDAQGADYGVDMDIYGVALGADYTLSNGLRLGAMFNVGSGDADGNGVASGISNDFDYYGFAVYGGYTMGALSVLADVSYTAVDNDFDTTTGLTTYNKLEGSADSDAWSIGVTGQYAIEAQGMTVTPHAGLRFTRLSIDDYTVKSAGGEIAGFDADDMNVFSIPVGVTFASEFTSGNWSVKPALDLTLTANTGDTDLDATSVWFDTDNGYGDMRFGTSTEVLDSFTYGATLGVAAKTGNFSLGLGVNYTGSSNTDEFGVQANARFMF